MTEQRKVCYACFMLHYYKRPYAKHLRDLNWNDQQDMAICDDCRGEVAHHLVEISNLNQLVCQSVVFADSDIYWLIEQIKKQHDQIVRESCGHTFNQALIYDIAGRAQVFVDRIVAVVWDVKRNKWRQNIAKTGTVTFNAPLKDLDVGRFLYLYEYTVVHEVIHQFARINDEDQTHRAASALVNANWRLKE
jgi:protein-arginine kinase activator protein McsA